MKSAEVTYTNIQEDEEQASPMDIAFNTLEAYIDELDKSLRVYLVRTEDVRYSLALNEEAPVEKGVPRPQEYSFIESRIYDAVDSIARMIDDIQASGKTLRL